MGASTKLGNNIRSLRIAYGETQEKLGEFMNVTSKAIANYENGSREPGKDMIAELAKHYQVSTDMLINGDFSGLGKINVDNNAIWRNVYDVFPIVSCQKSRGNSSFCKAYQQHIKIYDELKQIKIDNCFDYMAKCMEDYVEALEDEECCEDAAVNLLAIWFLFMIFFKTSPMIMKVKPAALMQVAGKDPRVRRSIDEAQGQDYDNAIKELEEIFDDPEMNEEINELFRKVKESSARSDIAYYYLALRYIFNLTDNGSSWEINRLIGSEMLNSLILVGNTHAKDFIQVSKEAEGQSTQIVEKK